MEARTNLQIRRKPVHAIPQTPPPPYSESPTSLSASTYGGYNTSLFDDYAEAARPRPTFQSADDHFPAPSSTPRLRATRSTPNFHQPPSTDPLPPLPSKRTEAAQKAGNAVVTAFEEARHFAGGLISHPYESTKHYSILRHSHGLVFYSGSHTSIAITVFADRELPPDRSFWLQRKGWSGNTGLKAGALFGAHSAWIDVTPSTVATVDQVKPTDERAWQRDIDKFLRKAPRKIADHVPRETAVLRIPCEAEDGYLRIVMCCGENGKKTLCPSPVFRLASTSLEASSMRGASLKTLPIEAAVKIGTTVGTQVATRLAGPYALAAKTAATNTVGRVFTPTTAQKTAAQRAYSSSGISTKLDSMNEAYEQRRAEQSAASLRVNTSPAVLQLSVDIGDDFGPAPPYPIRFDGKVAASPPLAASSSYMTLPLTSVSGEIPRKHLGTHIGHASIKLPSKTLMARNLTDEWHRAIISIQPLAGAPMAVVQKNVVTVTILPTPAEPHDHPHILPPALLSPGALQDVSLSVLLMAFVQPPTASPLPSSSPGPSLHRPRTANNPTSATTLFATTSSIPPSTTRTNRPAPSPIQSLSPPPTATSPNPNFLPLPIPSLIPQTHHLLSLPTFSPIPALAAISSRSLTSLSPSHSLTDRYVALRENIQDSVDRVPAHWVGVRTEGGVRRDEVVGRGGFFVRR